MRGINDIVFSVQRGEPTCLPLILLGKYPTWSCRVLFDQCWFEDDRVLFEINFNEESEEGCSRLYQFVSQSSSQSKEFLLVPLVKMNTCVMILAQSSHRFVLGRKKNIFFE